MGFFDIIREGTRPIRRFRNDVLDTTEGAIGAYAGMGYGALAKGINYLNKRVGDTTGVRLAGELKDDYGQSSLDRMQRGVKDLGAMAMESGVVERVPVKAPSLVRTTPVAAPTAVVQPTPTPVVTSPAPVPAASSGVTARVPRGFTARARAAAPTASAPATASPVMTEQEYNDNLDAMSYMSGRTDVIPSAMFRPGGKRADLEAQGINYNPMDSKFVQGVIMSRGAVAPTRNIVSESIDPRTGQKTVQYGYTGGSGSETGMGNFFTVARRTNEAKIEKDLGDAEQSRGAGKYYADRPEFERLKLRELDIPQMQADVNYKNRMAGVAERNASTGEKTLSFSQRLQLEAAKHPQKPSITWADAVKAADGDMVKAAEVMRGVEMTTKGLVPVAGQEASGRLWWAKPRVATHYRPAGATPTGKFSVNGLPLYKLPDGKLFEGEI